MPHQKLVCRPSTCLNRFIHKITIECMQIRQTDTIWTVSCHLNHESVGQSATCIQMKLLIAHYLIMKWVKGIQQAWHRYWWFDNLLSWLNTYCETNLNWQGQITLSLAATGHGDPPVLTFVFCLLLWKKLLVNKPVILTVLGFTDRCLRKIIAWSMFCFVVFEYFYHVLPQVITLFTVKPIHKQTRIINSVL